jgi:hypothetical protein
MDPKTWSLFPHTPHLEISTWRFCSCEASWSSPCPCLDGKNIEWCCQRWSNEFFKMVMVQWWVPMKKRENLDKWHLYGDCWNGKWKCNLAYQSSGSKFQLLFFLFLFEKIRHTQVKLLFFIVILLKQKRILTLLMHLIIREVCWWPW